MYGLRSSTGERSFASRPPDGQLGAVQLEQLARADADPVRPALVALRKDPDRGPLRVAAWAAGPDLVGAFGDLVEDIHDIDVRELAEASE